MLLSANSYHQRWHSIKMLRKRDIRSSSRGNAFQVCTQELCCVRVGTRFLSFNKSRDILAPGSLRSFQKTNLFFYIWGLPCKNVSLRLF